MRYSLSAFAFAAACTGSGEKEAVLVDDCSTAPATAFDVWSGEDTAVQVAVDAFDAISGEWSAVDSCDEASMTLTITPCGHGDIAVIDAGEACDSLALVSATVAVSHSTLGTLTFAMEGTLNEPGGWNVVDMDGVAAESDIRLSLVFDGEGGVIGTLLSTSGQDDASCQITDFLLVAD